jgi:hypothetical protein
MAQIQLKDLESYISHYKTTTSKKAALTKEIKALKERYKDVEDAYKEGKRRGQLHGWLFGKKIFLVDVKSAERDILIVERFKKEKFE